MTLFLLGPLLGIWIMRGSLSSSVILDTVPLSDPFIVTQLLFAGHWPEMSAMIGAALVTLFYLLVGGRVYCAWVCPVNLITDLAAWLRQRFSMNAHTKISKNIRHIVLASALLVPLIVSIVAWELINPVSMFNRGIVFGIGYGWLVLLTIFLFDLAVVRHGWCGHICPMGAFYGLIGKASLTNISASHRQACNQCGDCYLVCPEPQVLKSPLKDAAKGSSPVILASDCTNCGRCIDVCAHDVFEFKFGRRS
jgi:ferredoxin-type protein NapH